MTTGRLKLGKCWPRSLWRIFDSFTGSGFANSPSAGQLDSDVWQVSGLSDGDSTFGGNHTTGDFARGLTSGSVSTGGVYAFDVGSNQTLGAQPTAADMTPGSFTLKLANTSGDVANQFTIGYDVWILNDEDRAVSIDLSFSTNNVSFIPLPAVSLATPVNSDTAGWTATSLDTAINVAIPADGELYFRWTIDDAGGAGSRDQVGFDNVVVSADLVSTSNSDLRIASYNVENGPFQASDEPDFETIFAAIGQEEIAGVVRPVDLLVLQETDDISAFRIESIFDGLYTADYDVTISNNSGGDWFGFVWNTETLTLLETEIFSGPYTRDPFRGLFQPVGAIAGDSDFHVIDVHLNASNASTRLTEANNLRAEIDALGNDENVLLLGDLNIDSSFEGSYVSLLANGAGQLFDPIDAAGTWHDNPAFLGIHTQNPRSQMDDRFDFHLLNDDVLTTGGLEFIPGSYRAFGNNGTHNLNTSITTGSGASSAVLAALAIASDHLPVVADYRFEVPTSNTVSISIGETNRGILAADSASGTGYLMYSAESVHTRFAFINPNNADHIVAVRLNGSQWQYTNKESTGWRNFTPAAGDVLLADVDYSNDTVASLEGTSSVIEGIDAGYTGGDLVFTPDIWNGLSNDGEFGVAGTFFTVGTSHSSIDVTPLNWGVLAADNSTGTGYLMYSAESVHTRFASINPNNADHIVAVRLNGSQWQYTNKESTGWINFTPAAGDVLLADVDYSNDTVTSLEGTGSVIEGINAGYTGGDLVFTPDIWNGLSNDGEFGVTGTFFMVEASSGTTIDVTPLNWGVLAADNSTGTGYLMYSAESVHTRFASINPNNADHIVAVRLNGSQWQYTNKESTGWINFTPAAGDVLLADVDYSNDTVTSLEGTSSVIGGIDAGYISGDLVFTANIWNGAFNNGEFGVTGTFFEVNA